MNHILTTSRLRRAVVVGGLVALAPLGVARASTDTTTPDPAATESTAGDSSATTAGESSATTAAAEPVDLDANGDGKVVIGIATPGPRDDGAYYEALVTGVTTFTEEHDYEEPIVVDNIEAAQADTELRNLARQNVDLIAVGASELADPLAALVEEFPDIFWYCNCGAGLGDMPGLAQATDDSSQISYTAGYATGLLLQDTDSTKVAFLGCCDLDFEKEAYLAFEAGLHALNPDFDMTYIPTGDFNDVAAATEAFNQAIADGAGAVYPFLGGSHEAIVGLANDAGIITMSAGASDACERDDLTYDIAVQFDAGDYVGATFQAIRDGTLAEGETMKFEVGKFDKVGAKICDPTPEQDAAMAAVNSEIAAGDLADEFGQIKGEAYGGASTDNATATSAATATTAA